MLCAIVCVYKYVSSRLYARLYSDMHGWIEDVLVEKIIILIITDENHDNLLIHTSIS